MKIIWRLVPEISGATNRIFCHFGPFSDLWLSWQFNISKFWKNEKKAWRYHDLTLKYHKWRSYDLWFLTYRAVQTFLLPFSAIFCLYPTNNLKNQNFEKTKKCFEISFYTCVPQMTIIWCVSWDMEGKIIFLSFWTIFRPFTPLTTLKIKTLKK